MYNFKQLLYNYDQRVHNLFPMLNQNDIIAKRLYLEPQSQMEKNHISTHIDLQHSYPSRHPVVLFPCHSGGKSPVTFRTTTEAVDSIGNKARTPSSAAISAEPIDELPTKNADDLS